MTQIRKEPKTYWHLGIILVAGLVYSLVVANLPLDVFWIIDGGNKYIQIQSMEMSGFPDVSVQYPARDIDPGLSFFPYCGHHYREVGDKIYSAFPFYFPLLSLVPFQLIGIAGIYVIPVLSSVLCLVFTCLIVYQIRGHSRCSSTLLILAFLTPLLFYSLTFWEHSLATMLSTLCLLFMLRSRKSENPGRLLILAGFILGLSTIFREEGYLLFGSLVVGFLYAFQKKANVFFLLMGWLVVMVPIWIFQQVLYNHFLGIHALIYNESLSDLSGTFGLFNPVHVAGNWFAYLLKFHSNPQLSIALSSPFLAALAVGLIFKTSPRMTPARSILAVCTCVSSAVLLGSLVSHDDPVFNTLFTQALLPSTPFLVFFVLCLRSTLFSKNPDLRFLVATILLYVMGSGLLLNQKDVGIVWGPRHFVSLYPVLVPLSLIALESFLLEAGRLNQSILRVCAVTLFAISLLIQWHGVHTLSLKKSGTKAIVETVKSLDNEFVVTDVYWFPEEVASIYYKNKILMVDSDEDLSSLLRLFRTNDIENFTFVTSKYYHRLSNKGLEQILPFVESTRLIAPPGMEFLSLHVSDCKL